MPVLFPLSLFARTMPQQSAPLPGAPLSFIENKGQIKDQNHNLRTDIDYKLDAQGLNIFFGDGQIHYQWSKESGMHEIPVPQNAGHKPQYHTYDMYRMDVTLVGANKNAQAIREEQQQYEEHYYLPGCDGATAHTFGKVTYKDVYPGIDWVLYTQNGGLKYDFVVHAGADPSVIKLKYEGATSLQLLDGSVIATTPMGKINEQKPFAYNAESKAMIASYFIIENNIISFNVTPSSGTMVIDPAINWSTYYGFQSSTSTTANAVAADENGNAYIAGTTSDQSNIATFGSFQYSYGGGSEDAFIVKMLQAGGTGARSWATYYGGSDYEEGYALSYSTGGYLYLGGFTLSSSLPGYSTYGPGSSTTFVRGSGSYSDIYVAKFNTSGSMVWERAWGGDNTDILNTLATDKNDNVYIAGQTQSGITTPNVGLLPGVSGTRPSTPLAAGYVQKLSSSGTIQWGNFYSADIASIACDTSGGVYITGNVGTSYTNVVVGTIGQTSFQGGASDGFLRKINGSSSSGSTVWSFYLGGGSYENIRSVACDIWGNVYVGGETQSSGMASTGAYHTSNAGGSDGYIAKFNTSGTKIWSTYYGGTDVDYVTRVYAGPDGKVFAFGNTESSSGIATSGIPSGLPVHSTYAGGYSVGSSPPPFGDVFIAKFDVNGTRLMYGGYYGGAGDEEIRAAAVNGNRIYITGGTTSPKINYNAYLDTFLGTRGAFLAQLQTDTGVYMNVNVPTHYIDTVICRGDSLSMQYGVTDTFNAGNVFTVQLSDGSGSFASPITLGTKTSQVGGSMKYGIPSTTPDGTGYRIRVISSSPADTSIQDGKDIRVAAYPVPSAVADSPVCAGTTLHLQGSDLLGLVNTQYSWKFPDGSTVLFSNYDISNVSYTDSGYYVLTTNNWGCIRKDSVHVVPQPNPTNVVVHSNSPVCQGDTLKVWITTADTTGVEWNWFKPNVGFVLNGAADTTIPTASLSDSGIYKAQGMLNGCPSNLDSTKVTIIPSVTPNITLNVTPGALAGPGVLVTFNGTNPVNAGSSPTYHWLKNSFYIPNNTTTTFSGTMAIDIQTGDTICIEMTSNAQCARPKVIRSCADMTVDLSVGKLNAAGDIQLFPNPNEGSFMLKGNIKGHGSATIEILNAVGQTVYSEVVPIANGNLDKQMSISGLSAGSYMLRLVTDAGVSGQRFTVR